MNNKNELVDKSKIIKKRGRPLSKKKAKKDANLNVENVAINTNDNNFHNILSFLIRRYRNGFAIVEGVLNRVELKTSLCLRYDYIRLYLSGATIDINGDKNVFEATNYCSSWANDMRGIDVFRNISMMPTDMFLKKSIEILNEKFLNRKVAIKVVICVKSLHSKFYNLFHIEEAD